MSICLRPLQPADLPAVLALFRTTVRRINARDYDAAQVAAWASDEIDETAWGARFDGRFAVVAEIDGALAGFADLAPDGLLDRLFVSADHQRLGVGRALLDAVRAEARRAGIARIVTDASITARPFFAREGFETLAEQSVIVRGARLTNHRMQYVIEDAECST